MGESNSGSSALGADALTTRPMRGSNKTDTVRSVVTVLQADMTLKSGPTTRHLDCASSRDPRQVFPFTALLNHSNVATVELFLHTQLPEFVWIGFECQSVCLSFCLMVYLSHTVSGDRLDRLGQSLCFC